MFGQGIDQQMGTACHSILEAHYNQPPGFRSEKVLYAAATTAHAGLDLSRDKAEDGLREKQLNGYAKHIWKTWGMDEDIPVLVAEYPVEVDGPWDDPRTFLCIPDAYAIDEEKNMGIIMSHKSRLSQLPDLHMLVKLHQQAPCEAWALRRAFNLDSVLVYINGLTPTKVEREGPMIYTKEEDERTEAFLRTAIAQVGQGGVLWRSGPHCYQCEFRGLHESMMTPGADVEQLKAEYR
jgi:hypothetical protein